MSLDTIWHPAWAIIEYLKPYFRYNQPKAKPRPPFNKKHLNTNIGVKPKSMEVTGRCPAANKIEAIIFDIIKMVVEGFS